MALRLKGSKPSAGGSDRRYYMVDIQDGSRRVRLSAGTRDKALAAKRESTLLDMLRADPNVTKDALRAAVRGTDRATSMTGRLSSGMTLTEAYRRAMSDPYVWGQIKRPDAVKSHMSVIMRVFGADTPMKSITGDVISKAVDRMLRGEGGRPDQPDRPRCNGTINRKLTTLQRLLHAHAEWTNQPADSVPKCHLLKERGEREWVFDDDTEALVLDAVLAWDSRPADARGAHLRKNDAHRYHKLYILLAETGLRHSEAFGLEWPDIDFQTHTLRVWRVDKLKTRSSARSVPLTQRCEQALKSGSCPREGTTGPFDGLSLRHSQDLWKAARESVGITHKDAVPHALRHTAATRVLAATGDLRLTQKWLGHSNSSTTERYAKVVDSRMRAAAAMLDGRRHLS